MAFALLLARWVTFRDPGAPEARRVVDAVRRAITLFLQASYRLVAVQLAAVGCLLAVLHLLAPNEGRLAGLELLLWSGVVLVLGAAAACAAIQVSVVLAAAGVSRGVAAGRVGLDRAMRVSIRASGAASLVVETMSMLGVIVVVAFVFAITRDGSHLHRAIELASRLTVLCPVYALGAAAAALLVQRAGTTYDAAADAGGDMAGEREAGLEHDDARNPSMVADLIGDHVGSCASRAADLFVSGTLAQVAGLLLGAALIRQDPAHAGVAVLMTALPAVIRAFGVVASGFGFMVVRLDEKADAARGLWRGYATTAAIVLGGLAGSCIWLTRDHWWCFFGSGLGGLLCITVLCTWSGIGAGRRGAHLREVLEAIRSGSTSTIIHGLGSGLESVLLPASVMAVTMTAAWHAGVGSGLFAGGPLGLLTCVATILAMGGYCLTVGHFAPVADSARGVSSMVHAGAEQQHRMRELDRAGIVGGRLAQTYLILTGCLVTLVATLPLFLLGAPARADSAAFPAIVWCAMFGSMLVLFNVGSSLRHVSRAVRQVAAEIERQLRGFPREYAGVHLPDDYTPSYRSVIEILGKVAGKGGVGVSVFSAFVPAAVGVTLGLLYGKTDPGIVGRGLTSYALAACIVGLAASLAFDAARATLSAARRATTLQSSVASLRTAVSADAFADAFGKSAGPAAHLVVRLSAAVCLAVAPLVI